MQQTSASVPSYGTQFDEIISFRNKIDVVFDQNNRVSFIDQSMQEKD